MSRSKLTEDRKKKVISITLQPDVLLALKTNADILNMSRSEYINKKLRFVMCMDPQPA